MSNTKRSFESLGKQFGKSGDTIKRWLPIRQDSQNISIAIAKYLFKAAKVLTLAVDDTLLQKAYSQFMVGASYFFDSKINRSIMAYRLVLGAITDGKHIVPIDFGYMFNADTLFPEDEVKTKLDFVKQFYNLAKQIFPNIKLKLAAKVVWNGLELYLTAERRIDKHGNESIVYLVATYKVKPIQYVHDYRKRWTIEKFFRTSKQMLGLAECFSRQLVTQKHIASVLLSYGLAQLEMKQKKLAIPEDAIRAIKQQDAPSTVIRFS